MQMISARQIILAASLLVTPFLSAQTPAPNTTQWENDTLNLRLFYPSDLVSKDPAQAHSGLLNLSDPAVAETTRCLHPTLLLSLPESQPTTATILLAELDPGCLTDEQQLKSTTLLADMAGIVNKLPGMKPIARPSNYTIGWQKVYMAAAQGQTPQSTPSAPQQLFTMAIATNWNSHLLVWYFSSNSIDTLNRITKTTVRFGRAQAAPLYPVTIGTAAP